jgi:phosphoribosyl-ATP pyrophosphohydrolase/phosphoribosyl-AMP cyclohydrolase
MTSEPLSEPRLDFSRNGGYVTVIAQDARTGRVLMTARADRDAIAATLRTGQMHYSSRTRGLWHKGATSGNVQRVVALIPDCDGDAVLARVVPAGPACHTGRQSCFDGAASSLDVLEQLDRVIATRAAAAADVPTPGADAGASRTSYTRRLLADRNLRLKKLGEEAAELAVACADGDAARAASECADLLYHALVAMRALGVGLDEVAGVLAERQR